MCEDQSFSLLVTSLHRTDLTEHGATADRSLEVLACGVDRSDGELVRLVDAPLEQQGTGEQGTGLASIGTDAQRTESLVSHAQVRLGCRRIAGQQFRKSGEQFGLEQTLAQTEISSGRTRDLEFVAG